MSIRRASPCPVFVLLAVGSIATAQDAATPSDTPAAIPAEKSDAPDVSFRLGGFGTYHLKADLDKNGDVSLSLPAGGEVGVNIPFGKSVFLDVAFREEMSWYTSNAIDLGGTDSPWDGPMYDHRLDPLQPVRAAQRKLVLHPRGQRRAVARRLVGVGLDVGRRRRDRHLLLQRKLRALRGRSGVVVPGTFGPRLANPQHRLEDQRPVARFGRGVGRLANRGPGLALLDSPSETWTFGRGRVVRDSRVAIG